MCDHRCDACGRDIPETDGGPCGPCVQQINDDRNREWWQQ